MNICRNKGEKNHMCAFYVKRNERTKRMGNEKNNERMGLKKKEESKRRKTKQNMKKERTDKWGMKTKQTQSKSEIKW